MYHQTKGGAAAYAPPTQGAAAYAPPTQGAAAYAPPTQGTAAYAPPTQGAAAYAPPTQGAKEAAHQAKRTRTDFFAQPSTKPGPAVLQDVKDAIQSFTKSILPNASERQVADAAGIPKFHPLPLEDDVDTATELPQFFENVAYTGPDLSQFLEDFTADHPDLAQLLGNVPGNEPNTFQPLEKIASHVPDIHKYTQNTDRQFTKLEHKVYSFLKNQENTVEDFQDLRKSLETLNKQLKSLQKRSVETVSQKLETIINKIEHILLPTIDNQTQQKIRSTSRP